MLEVRKSETYDRWFSRLRDARARARILKQVGRIRDAGRVVGDWKHMGDGVIEVRIDYGPGYRLYLSVEHNTILLLLVGGEKHGQQADINRAKQLLAEWRRNNG